MTQGQTGWLFLLIASFCIFCIGMQGSLGVFIAIIFSPSAVTTSETGTAIAATALWTTAPSTITSALNAAALLANTASGSVSGTTIGG